MKILLIYPYFIEERIHAEEVKAVPIGLYNVAAVLKEKGYDVKVLNWHDADRRPDEMEKILMDESPDIIGFSILHANRWGGIEIARIARRLRAGTTTVFGGIGATFLWEHLLTHFPEIDVVVLGEGERSFLELVEWMEKQGPHRQLGGWPEDIRGIAFRKGGKATRTGEAKPVGDLNGLPIPAKYFRYQHLSTARGCAWNCRFCGSPAFWKRNLRFRSPQHVLEELEALYRQGVTFYYFSDDTFTVKKDRAIEICKGIIEKKLPITWSAISRVDCVDEETLYWMRMAGCIQISYGVESGSEKIRARLHKEIKTDQIKRAFSLTVKYGILSRAYFIYGGPGENWSTIQDTIDLIHEIKPLGAVFYILDIFPGTGLYEDLKERLKINDDIWLNKIEGIMHFETVPGLSKDLIPAFGKRLRNAFYENVHHFVDSVELLDDGALYGRHADFFSRLGMTFSHGDYSKIEAVLEKEQTAENLFRRSLGYAHDQRAYLGLGILHQRRGDHAESAKILRKGLEVFHDDKELHLCLGISLMNLSDFESALALFEKFPDSARANAHMADCHRALGSVGKESACLEKYRKLKR